MFWEVDGGAYNWMGTNTQNYPHKEADVNLSGWNWHPDGNYTLAFIAQDLHGNEIARTTVQIHIQGATTTTAHGVFTNATLYVHPNTVGVPSTIAAGATAQWFGDWNSNVAADVNTLVTAAHAANSLPILVAYDIPDRDCGGYSSNGAVSASAYQQWIASFASGIKNRSAVVILEPDATSQVSCLSANDLQARYSLLSGAVSTLKAAGASVYIDAGHPNWISASDMANRLNQSGITQADGFAINVSNFYTTSDDTAYGNAISALVGNKHFVIDTSRNGNGPTSDNQWCNPSGRALGSLPTSNTGAPLTDAFLWIKVPGESDGTCNGGPSAGTFWESYAEQLIANMH
jgi:endoglucanase